MRDLQILLALGALGAVLTGCRSTEPTCNAPADGCPRSTFTTQMTSGTLAYKVGSATSATRVLVGQAAPSDNTCTALNLDGEIFKDEFVNFHTDRYDEYPLVQGAGAGGAVTAAGVLADVLALSQTPSRLRR